MYNHSQGLTAAIFIGPLKRISGRKKVSKSFKNISSHRDVLIPFTKSSSLEIAHLKVLSSEMDQAESRLIR